MTFEVDQLFEFTLPNAQTMAAASWKSATTL